VFSTPTRGSIPTRASIKFLIIDIVLKIVPKLCDGTNTALPTKQRFPPRFPRLYRAHPAATWTLDENLRLLGAVARWPAEKIEILNAVRAVEVTEGWRGESSTRFS
jgi:hypothetical protein